MVVVTAVTFNLILLSTLTGIDFLSDDAWNMFQCATSCSLKQDCGGYNWDENQTPHCKLIMWADNGIRKNGIAGKTYRRLHYQGKILVGSPATSVNIRTIHARCVAMNTVPILPPLTNLDKSIFQIRPKHFIILGIKRQSPPSLIYTDHTGKEYDIGDSSLYKWISNEPTNNNKEYFMYMDSYQQVADAVASTLFRSGTCLLCMQI